MLKYLFAIKLNNLGVRFYATKKTVKATPQVQPETVTEPKISLLTKIGDRKAAITAQIKDSKTMSSYKTLSRSYSNYKSSFGNFISVLLSFVGLDKVENSKVFTIVKFTFKWLFRSITFFKVVLAILDFFYFNTTIITAKLL